MKGWIMFFVGWLILILPALYIINIWVSWILVVTGLVLIARGACVFWGSP